MLADLRFAFRSLRQRPGFALVAILVLALGIGANTAIFSVVYAALLKPLPYREPERLAFAWEQIPQLGAGNMAATPADFLDLREMNRSFEALAGFEERSLNLSGPGAAAERVNGLAVTPDLFPLLGVAPALGRWFPPEEKSGVAIISHGLWQRRFGGDPGIVGQAVRLDHQTHTITGVMPSGFVFPPESPVDVWVPLHHTAEEIAGRGNRFDTAMIGRLKPGVTVAAAAADLDRAAALILQRYGANARGAFQLHATATSVAEDAAKAVKAPLWILQGAAGLVLLIACANVANLLIARSAARQREIAIRGALGAGRFRIARLLATESLVLALAGGAAGWLLALWAADLLLSLRPDGFARLGSAALDPRVALFTLAVALLAGVLFALVPALSGARLDLNTALKQNTRGVASRSRLRRALIVAEVALSLVLLTGSGLLIRSFLRLLATDPGFRPDRTVAFTVSLPSSAYPGADQARGFYRQLLDNVRGVPGVAQAGLATSVPLATTGRVLITPDNFTGTEWGRNMCWFAAIDGDYFGSLGVALEAGRLFGPEDRRDAPRRAIVNRAFAEKYWPGGNAVGRRFKWGSPRGQAPYMEIVGVAANVIQNRLDQTPEPAFYIPFVQHSDDALAFAGRTMTVVARTAGDAAALAPALREAVAAIDRDIPVFALRTMDEAIRRSEAGRRFVATLVSGFAGAAALLAAIGLFGVISHSVTAATREIGIRMALGAERRRVVALVLAEGMRLAAAGIAAGLAAALLLTRYLASQLYQVSAADPWVFSGVALLLALVAALACYLPARRATRIDPVIALRAE
jgi:predicted permease